jgi:hypothetical protein
MDNKKVMHDDFTRITGIGIPRQEWLNTVFNVFSYEDLASLSVDQIAAKFKAEGKPYKRNVIEKWPLEAAQLAVEKTRPSKPKKRSPLSESVEMQEFESKNNKRFVLKNQNGQWKSFATFVTEFRMIRKKDNKIEKQINISYHDTDIEETFHIDEYEQIGHWMIEQVGDRLFAENHIQPAPVLGTPNHSQPATSLRLTLNFTGFHLFQPIHREIRFIAGEDSRPYVGVIEAGKPFVIEANFCIKPETRLDFGHTGIPYLVQFVGQRWFERRNFHLGESVQGVITSKQMEYSAKSSEIVLASGSYRLQIIVLPESEHVLPCYFELPMLRVI